MHPYHLQSNKLCVIGRTAAPHHHAIPAPYTELAVYISRNTITSLAADATKRIDYDTMNGLCNGLKITPGELFEYIPDNNEETP
ncbi:helix-turn-helix domain-containing protein [Paenibacillus alginolyticus]|uniref:Helix-turn-helix transcriptional regulator n=1 Tax=Paenibacillus alginolyticus TaxID=59839 RepID=A0ABT4GH12_9BACL|nr:helix-turn-helix transcriptional regulator [Paenibacillus alginolyticus]MCY9695364.1 helix-turn-helix transcriptional regulator [Paenibacillus alginolyticus]MEC0148894.1 helix-turn-helix transcriptional regulator [Paenibacillus alginolyticus]